MKGNIQKLAEVSLANLGTVSERTLEIIVDSHLLDPEHIVSSLVNAFFPHANAIEYKNEKRRVERALKSMEKQKIIQLTEDSRYTLTQRGRWESARRRLLDAPEEHVPDSWDRKWRVIIFDVPEVERPQRDKLRRSFVYYGMYQLQKSVWAYPYKCESFIQSIKEDLGLSAEVLYMLVDKIENQKHLKQEFSLK